MSLFTPAFNSCAILDPGIPGFYSMGALKSPGEETQKKKRDVIQTTHICWKCKRFYIYYVYTNLHIIQLYTLVLLYSYYVWHSIFLDNQLLSIQKSMFKEKIVNGQLIREWIIPNISQFPKSWSYKWFHMQGMLLLEMDDNSWRTNIISQKSKRLMSSLEATKLGLVFSWQIKASSKQNAHAQIPDQPSNFLNWQR